jgi:DNA-binding NarL/FixJ family response regulator
MIRAFIIASAPMMRAGLQAMLTTTEIQVVGEAAVPARIIAAIPDIDVLVVADEKILEEVATTIRSIPDAATIAIVALSNNDEYPASILHSLALGGWSIVPPDVSPAGLQAAIVTAIQGFVTFPAPLAERILGQLGRRVPVEAMHIDAPDEPLTSREREVLEMLSRGLSNKMIARRLSISEHTVKFHVSSIYTKLGAASRTDAVSRGVRRGLITL